MLRFIVLSLLLLAGPAGFSFAESVSPDTPHWLMLVATKNLEATQEAAFNHWYDDIDIPDVLKVPGYKRARRGVRQIAPGFSTPDPETEGHYLALYDIESANIDRTIIDMLMAAKKMDMTGRSIAALKVTERVYFRRLGNIVEAANTAGKSGNSYLYLERVACCRDEATANALDDWYDNTRIPDIVRAGTPGLVRVARFEVYRVVMVEPLQVPRFLILYEFNADSAGQVLTTMRRANEQMKKSGRDSDLFAESGSIVLKQIKDVRRQ